MAPPLVTIWTIPARHQDEASLWNVLHEEERRRADRFRRPQDRQVYIVARGSLRLILGRELGCEPEQIVFLAGPHGKPQMEGCTTGFNVSHAGDWVWIAVSGGCDVGVDLERTSLEIDPEWMRGIASAEEWEHFSRVKAPDREAAFFAWWTRKEAYLKGIGTGLAGADPAAITAWVGDRKPLMIGGWRVISLDGPSGYAAALAVHAHDVSVEIRPL